MVGGLTLKGEDYLLWITCCAPSPAKLSGVCLLGRCLVSVCTIIPGEAFYIAMGCQFKLPSATTCS